MMLLTNTKNLEKAKAAGIKDLSLPGNALLQLNNSDQLKEELRNSSTQRKAKCSRKKSWISKEQLRSGLRFLMSRDSMKMRKKLIRMNLRSFLRSQSPKQVRKPLKKNTTTLRDYGRKSNTLVRLETLRTQLKDGLNPNKFTILKYLTRNSWPQKKERDLWLNGEISDLLLRKLS